MTRAPTPVGQLFYIASLKHTNRHHEHIVWWAKAKLGYTPVLGDWAGTYTGDEAKDLNDGVSCMAVPVEAVRALITPEPYYRPGGRFYDQRGPVVLNSRPVWNALIRASQPQCSPKPVVFRGVRRSYTPATADPAYQASEDEETAPCTDAGPHA